MLSVSLFSNSPFLDGVGRLIRSAAGRQGAPRGQPGGQGGVSAPCPGVGFHAWQSFAAAVPVLSRLLPAAKAAGYAVAPGLHPRRSRDGRVAYRAPEPGKCRELLATEFQRHPRNLLLRVRRASLFDRAGDRGRARCDYDLALDSAGRTLCSIDGG